MYFGNIDKGKETISVLTVCDSKAKSKKERFCFLPLINPLIFHDGLSLEEILHRRGAFHYAVQGNQSVSKQLDISYRSVPLYLSFLKSQAESTASIFL